jgi:hypothetical protein
LGAGTATERLSKTSIADEMREEHIPAAAVLRMRRSMVDDPDSTQPPERSSPSRV